MKQMQTLSPIPAYFVAPRAGAWIETARFMAIRQLPMSPPARGRGLKLFRQ